VRWWAQRNKITYGEAASSPTFQRLWERRRDADRETRLEALREMGVLVREDDGNWRYSDAFMAWLFE
jgi:hypothetical protein